MVLGVGGRRRGANFLAKGWEMFQIVSGPSDICLARKIFGRVRIFEKNRLFFPNYQTLQDTIGLFISSRIANLRPNLRPDL